LTPFWFQLICVSYWVQRPSNPAVPGLISRMVPVELSLQAVKVWSSPVA
jgi:hypothetical protein